MIRTWECRNQNPPILPLARENGIALAGDERRGICHPHQLFLARWQIATEARALYREYIPLKFIIRSVGCRHVRSFAAVRQFAMPEFATAKTLWMPRLSRPPR